MNMIKRRLEAIRAQREHGAGDEGSALILSLVVIMVATLIVTPMLTYAVAVTRASRLVDNKAQRLEAVKGGLRTALADPVALFKACNQDKAGVNLNPVLASPSLRVPVATTCALMAVNYSEDETKRPYGTTSLQAGIALPAAYTPSSSNVHAVYPGSGQSDIRAWRNVASLTRSIDTIWSPNLPVHALSPRSAAAYNMPDGFDACKVYFPGTYVDPIVISGSTPVYFTSGVYYFENSITITDNASVVVGGGAIEGCTSDQFAAFYAVNAPATHNITGLGSTFVFGMTGRLLVKNSVPFTGATTDSISLVFNQRYVSATDTNTLPSATVNIMSVNGSLPSSNLNNTIQDLDQSGVLYVPYSLAPTGATTFGAATLNKYRPSTLVPAVPDNDAIVEVNLTQPTATTVSVPGYVDVPQGRFLISIGAGLGAKAAINFDGGVLARTIEVPGDSPAKFKIGVSEVVTQLVLRLKSITTTGTPVVTSDAVVQVNANGAYAVNTWAVG